MQTSKKIKEAFVTKQVGLTNSNKKKLTSKQNKQKINT